MSGKVLPASLPKKETEKMLNLLYKKIHSLKTKGDIGNFLSDLLTQSEKVMILRRLQIAKLLLEGKTYFEIRKKLHVGTDTIKMVRHDLDTGSGGYLNFIKNL